MNSADCQKTLTALQMIHGKVGDRTRLSAATGAGRGNLRWIFTRGAQIAMVGPEN
jgi:hypothetical protein